MCLLKVPGESTSAIVPKTKATPDQRAPSTVVPNRSASEMVKKAFAAMIRAGKSRAVDAAM